MSELIKYLQPPPDKAPRLQRHLYALAYILGRLSPVIVCHIMNRNSYHNFALTALAEFFMSLDDVGIISYHSSKILGGTIFGIEKLLSYNSYTYLRYKSTLSLLSFVGYVLYRLYPQTEKTNILYMLIVMIWTLAAAFRASCVQMLGVLLYAITDYDVAMYDSVKFGRLLLPAYQFSLLLLSR